MLVGAAHNPLPSGVHGLEELLSKEGACLQQDHPVPQAGHVPKVAGYTAANNPAPNNHDIC
ncbi:MAG: hypothetical protein NZ578_13300 [Candidatus Binatia bacterium]|nr:hypothetical protein [Candidatus Binatia bacterium]